MADDNASPTDPQGPGDSGAYQGLAPGWYRDPADPEHARYWDGAKLSEQVQPLPASAESSPDMAIRAARDDEGRRMHSELDDLRSEVQELRKRVAAAEGHVSSIVEASPDGAVVVDSNGLIVYANAAAAELLGTTAPELLGEIASFTLRVAPDGRRRQEPGYAEMRVAGTEWEGKPAVLGLLRDVTKRHRAESQTAFRATHDPLTGLPNRYLLDDRLTQALARDRRDPKGLALLFCDVDRLKAINDLYGHDVGDQVLVEAAQRILGAIRPFDTAARVGGDEFVVLCAGVDEPAASAIAARLAASFDKHMTPKDLLLEVDVSIGLAVTNDPDVLPEALLAEADRAMYRTKRRRSQENGD